MASDAMTENRRIRADGHIARRRILDATAELAGERGFDGVSISKISEMSGLPKSSIYWHFGDKEQLFAAVVESSYLQWIERIKSATTPEDHRQLGGAFGTSIGAITESPDFLRLGLMLSLDQRDSPIPARTRFLEIRLEVQANLQRLYRGTFPKLSDDSLQTLAQLTMALTDGFFVAEQVGETTLADNHGLIERAVVAAAASLT